MLKKTHTFQLDYISEEDSQDFSGQFTVKKLSVLDRSKISVRKSQLNGGLYCVLDDEGNPTGVGIDQETDTFNYIIAYLEVALIQKPKTWNMSEITDTQVLYKVFGEATSFENSFRNRRPLEASQTGSDTKFEETIGRDDTPKMVDRKVLPSLDG